MGSENETQQVHIGLTEKQADVSISPEELELLHEGLVLINAEKEYGFKQAMRSHWRAALWSFALSWALVMEGFDSQLLSGYYGQPSFLRRFGNVTNEDGDKLLSAAVQAQMGNIGIIGNFIGLWFAGYGAARWGYRPMYIFGMVLMTLFVFLFVFCQSLPMLIVSQTLVNIPWGIFQTLTTSYAAELCPVALRAYLTGFVVMAWNIGQFISSFVLRAVSEVESDWAWRGPYAAQWVFPIPLLIIAYLGPESPWHYVRKGQFDRVKPILARVARPGHYNDRQLDAYVAYMKHTVTLEKAESANGSWLEMFKGSNLRRTEIMFGIWGLQNWCGNAMLGLGVVLLQTAGMSPALLPVRESQNTYIQTLAYDINTVINATNILAVAFGWLLLPHFGRRPLFLVGLVSLGGTLVVLGILAFVKQSPANLYAQGAMLVVQSFWFQANINPLSYAIAGEIPATRLRPQTIAMGRAFYVVTTVPLNQLLPYMLNQKPAGWGWGTKSAWFWLGCNILATLWVYFRLPETGGFSFAELDILFANKVSARKFKHVTIHDELADGETKAESTEQGINDNEKNEKDVAETAVYHLNA